MKPILPTSLGGIFVVSILLLTISAPTPALADGVQAWCGNGCSSEDDGATNCTWTPASSGQSCQAKAICSTNECTVWAVALNPGITGFAMTQAKARRLHGARSIHAARPPNKR